MSPYNTVVLSQSVILNFVAHSMQGRRIVRMGAVGVIAPTDFQEDHIAFTFFEKNYFDLLEYKTMGPYESYKLHPQC